MRKEKCLPGILVFDILNSASSFNGADGKTSRIRETAHNPCLPLERAGDGLIDSCGV
jgi:hypothetical protein